MKDPQEIPLYRPAPMGNFFLLNEANRWAAVCISKNGCTSLKASVLSTLGLTLTTSSEIHNAIGYTLHSPHLKSISRSSASDKVKFAVFRCPVERFISTYRMFSLDGDIHHRFAPLSGLGFDSWIDFAAREHSKPILLQDEHMRMQSDYYEISDVDDVVSIKDLDRYFLINGWARLPRINSARACFRPTPRQIRRIERLYERDFALADACRRFD